MDSKESDIWLAVFPVVQGICDHGFAIVINQGSSRSNYIKSGIYKCIAYFSWSGVRCSTTDKIVVSGKWRLLIDNSNVSCLNIGTQIVIYTVIAPCTVFGLPGSQEAGLYQIVSYSDHCGRSGFRLNGIFLFFFLFLCISSFFCLSSRLTDHGIVHLVENQAQNDQNCYGHQEAGSGIQAFSII